MATLLATYCSAQKKQVSGVTAAIDLYESKRIARIHELAEQHDKSFAILSGKYGLIRPEDQVEFYDHLLIEKEVGLHVVLLRKQLVELNPEKVVFYANNIKRDPKIIPYLHCIQKATIAEKIELQIVEAEFED